MPALAHWFHLTPADLDLMNPGEVEVFLDALNDINQAQRRGR